MLLDDLHALEEGGEGEPDAAGDFASLGAHEALDDLFLAHRPLVQLYEVVDRVVAFVLQEDLTVVLGSHTEELVEFAERLAFLLLVIPVERQHVLVLANKVIVDVVLVLVLLVHTIEVATAHLGDHARVALVVAALHMVLNQAHFLRIFRLEKHHSVSLLLDLLAVKV